METMSQLDLRWPLSPYGHYKDDWIGWGDFLGNGAARTREYLSFNHFVHFARSLSIKSKDEWVRYWREHKDCGFPANPALCYKDWTNWPDVLGVYTHAKGRLMPFQEARKIVRALGLSSREEYAEWREQQPDDSLLPKSPESTYARRGEWNGWYDFLGKMEPNYVDYDEAKRIVHPLNLKSWTEYHKAKSDGRIPKSVPISPEQVYKTSGTWKGIGDFLGSNNITYKEREWVSLDGLRNICKQAGIDTREKYKIWFKSNKTIDGKFVPSAPNHLFKNDGWNGWADLFGSKNKRGGFLPYEEAKKIVQLMKINNQTEWNALSKRGDLPNGVPASPRTVYGKQFEGWYIWFGKKSGDKQHWRSFQECREFARSEK
jgi:hypothetical protein